MRQSAFQRIEFDFKISTVRNGAFSGSDGNGTYLVSLWSIVDIMASRCFNTCRVRPVAPDSIACMFFVLRTAHFTHVQLTS